MALPLWFRSFDCSSRNRSLVCASHVAEMGRDVVARDWYLRGMQVADVVSKSVFHNALVASGGIPASVAGSGRRRLSESGIKKNETAGSP